MKKILFFRKRLDNPNGLVKDSSNEFMEQNETATPLRAMPSNSTAGLLARVVKGVVSFLQNLLSPLTCKEGVRTGQVSAFFQLAAAVVVGVGLLVGSNAEAQSPDIEVYGIDSHSVLQYFGGRWHQTVSKLNLIARPGGAVEGKAIYRANHLFPCYSRKYNVLRVRVQSTVWFSDGTHSDIEHYDVHCVQGQRQREDYSASPARYLNNKAMVVGTIRTKGGDYQITDSHLTGVHFTANHTSGEKNFTITIKYRVEGRSTVTTVQSSVVLKPGQKKSMLLFVPGSGSWASIDSITATEDRPPDPIPSPTPPVVTPVPVPRPVPVPAPPSNPNPNPRRPRR